MSRRLFLDTGVLLGAVLSEDADHEAAASYLERIAAGEWRSVHTSDYVIAEALNFIRMKVRRKETAEALRLVVFGAEDIAPMVSTVLRIHGGRFARAFAAYQTEFDRGLSFTDWTTVVAMREAGVREIATFDGRLEATLRLQG